MEHIANKTDEQLQRDVEAALKATLNGEAPHVGVSADHGTVTLSGELRTVAARTAAHDATMLVSGIHSLANDIVLRDPRTPSPNDTDIARDAQAALKRTDDVPNDTVMVEVTDGVAVLTGRVAGLGVRFAAERAVSYVRGIRDIDNRTTIDQQI